MNNAGVYSLCAYQVTVALTAEAFTAIDDLDGMNAVTLEALLQYGSGGTSISAVVQTSLDGTNWVDVARFDFTTSSSRKACNLSGLTAVDVGSVSTLSVEGRRDGFLGNTLRAVVTSVGTYVDTTLQIRAAVRG
jgi:hypothetical protein